MPEGDQLSKGGLTMGPRYYIGIDLHKSVIQACVLDAEGGVRWWII